MPIFSLLVCSSFSYWFYKSPSCSKDINLLFLTVYHVLYCCGLIFLIWCVILHCHYYYFLMLKLSQLWSVVILSSQLLYSFFFYFLFWNTWNNFWVKTGKLWNRMKNTYIPFTGPQMLAFYHICFIISLHLYAYYFFFSEPFGGQLQTWCTFTPKFFSVYFPKYQNIWLQDSDQIQQINTVTLLSNL